MAEITWKHEGCSTYWYSNRIKGDRYSSSIVTDRSGLEYYVVVEIYNQYEEADVFCKKKGDPCSSLHSCIRWQKPLNTTQIKSLCEAKLRELEFSDAQGVSDGDR